MSKVSTSKKKAKQAGPPKAPESAVRLVPPAKGPSDSEEALAKVREEIHILIDSLSVEFDEPSGNITDPIFRTLAAINYAEDCVERLVAAYEAIGGDEAFEAKQAKSAEVPS